MLTWIRIWQVRGDVNQQTFIEDEDEDESKDGHYR